MKYYLMTSFLFLTTFISIGQMQVSDLDRKTHAEQLQLGSLIVQLPNSDKKIAALEKNGQSKLAAIEKAEIKMIRKEIMDAFNEHYDFSDYYFVESEHVKEVIDGKYKNIFNRDFDKIYNKLPKGDYVYIVRYGVGNPNGEVYRYNGLGFQIRYVNNNILETIKSDTFFSAGGFRLFRKNKNTITRKTRVLNSKLLNTVLGY